MADKKLNNVSTLTSSTLASNDYAYVEDVSASNEQKKVTITDLAKVVGGQIGVTRTESFGLTEGESLTISISYGMLLIRDLATGGGALYPILNGTVKTPVYTYYNDNDGYYSVERVNAASVRITRNKTTNGQLRVLVLIA